MLISMQCIQTEVSFLCSTIGIRIFFFFFSFCFFLFLFVFIFQIFFFFYLILPPLFSPLFPSFSIIFLCSMPCPAAPFSPESYPYRKPSPIYPSLEPASPIHCMHAHPSHWIRYITIRHDEIQLNA